MRVAYVCMNANIMFHNVHVELRGQYSGASSHLPPHRGKVSRFCCCAVVCSRLAGPWASVPVSYLCLPSHCRVLILQMHMISAFRLEFCRSNYGPLVCDQHLHSLSRLPTLEDKDIDSKKILLELREVGGRRGSRQLVGSGLGLHSCRVLAC